MKIYHLREKDYRKLNLKNYGGSIAFIRSIGILNSILKQL